MNKIQKLISLITFLLALTLNPKVANNTRTVEDMMRPGSFHAQVIEEQRRYRTLVEKLEILNIEYPLVIADYLRGPRKIITPTQIEDIEPLARGYGERIIRETNKYGIDPLLILAVAKEESGFRRNIISKKGAKGIMQVKDIAARHMGIEGDLCDPDTSFIAGIKYIDYLNGRYKGEIMEILSIAAYHTGPKDVYKYNGMPASPTTRKHIKKVFSAFKDYQERLRARFG